MVLFICTFILQYHSEAQSKFHPQLDEDLLKTIDNNLTDAVAQYKVLLNNLPPGKFPKTYFPLTGKNEFSNSSWWCSGFYPGTLLNLYQQSHDTILYIEAMRMLELLKIEQFNTSTHDLGFMMYGSFGLANKLFPSITYKEILLNSAKSLASRFNPAVGCIKSWDGKPNEFLVIIDNMMNLKLLFWATEVSGDSSFYKIAVTHANTTLKNHFRSDNSSYHVLNYNATTGAVLQKRTAQGYSNESSWARGQAWGLYGFTEAYRETKDKKYLDKANKIALFILSHPHFPADRIAYWDFNAPDIPAALKDASAAAIMASALIELSGYVNKQLTKKYLNTAAIILKNLSGEKYKASIGTNGGFILMHSVGNMPNASEIDVPLTYTDYYFVEAMIRYKKLFSNF
jgi:hypothetical protein